MGFVEMAVAALVVLLAFALRFRENSGRHAVLIVSGRNPDRPEVVRGVTWLVPLLERAQRVDLRPWTETVQLPEHTIVAQVRVADEPALLERAAVTVLGKSREARQRVIREVIAGEAREALGEPEQLQKQLDKALSELGIRCDAARVNAD
jgi:uncharacterized membrane protein YqiK